MIRLHSIEIFKHSFFKPQKFDFVNDKDSKAGPYVTLLIGPNGTGKSQVLELINEIFNILAASQEKRKKVLNFKHDFQFIYFIDSDEIKFRSIKNVDEAWLNNNPIDIFLIPLPNTFLASAINLTDRFPNLTKSRKIYNKSYEYLDTRAASNNAFIAKGSFSFDTP